MARVLLALWAGGGNVPPQLLVAKRLARAGHRVEIYAPFVLRAPIRSPVARAATWLLGRVVVRFFDAPLPRLNRLRRALGLAPIRSVLDLLRSAARMLVLTSPALDFPARLPANVRYVGFPSDPDLAPRRPRRLRRRLGARVAGVDPARRAGRGSCARGHADWRPRWRTMTRRPPPAR